MVNLFDLIPSDVHQLVVSSLLSSLEFKYCNGKEYLMNEAGLRTILNYAKQSQDHHDAAIYALKFTIAPWECYGVTTDLIMHFAQDLHQIDTIYTDANFEMSSESVPELPNLRKAAIWASLPELCLIRNSQNLQDLTVIFLPDGDSNGNDKTEWNFFVSIISGLHIQTLEVIFKYPSATSCDKLSMVDLTKFKNACNTVECLSLRGCMSMTENLSHVISEMPNLKKLSLEMELNDSNLSVLENIPELEFFDAFTKSFPVIRKLGERVKKIEGGVESRSQIEAILSFPRLKHLHIQTSAELIYAIGDIVGNLEALSLSFPMYSLPHQGPIYPFYGRISMADLCPVMKRARKLSILSIDQVKISSEDVEEIFKIVGPQLRQFCVCINWQEEIPLARIANILRSIAMYCPNLEALRFLRNTFGICPTLLSDREQKRHCMKALKMVLKNCSRFSSYERICSIIQI